MKKINKPLENMGGLIKVWAIPSESYASALRIGKTVTFAFPNHIYEIYCAPDSGKFMEELDVSGQAGAIYNTEITGFVPGETAFTRTEFALMNDRRFIVVFMDANEHFLIAGTWFSSLRFSSRFSTGSNSADRPGHEISFAGRTFEKAILVDNPF